MSCSAARTLLSNLVALSRATSAAALSLQCGVVVKEHAVNGEGGGGGVVVGGRKVCFDTTEHLVDSRSVKQANVG